MAQLRAWDWSPGAEAMDEGYKAQALQKTLKGQRDLSTQQYGQKLAEMLYGQQLGQETKQMEARQDIPALRGMLRGTPELQQTLGYKPGYEPTDEELMGAHGIVKPMASEILKSKLPAAKGPVVVPRMGSLVDPQTGKVMFGGQGPQGLRTTDEAEAEIARLEQAHPEAKGRYEYSYDPTNDLYKIQRRSSEPIGSTDPIQQRYELNLRSGMDPTAAYNKYLEDKKAVAFNVSVGTTQGAPISPEWASVIRPLEQANAAMESLEQFSPEELRTFIGIFNSKSKDLLVVGRELPFVGAYIKKLGPEFSSRRFKDFQAVMGNIESMVFARGGKQLTPFEAKTAMKSIPSGEELSYAAFMAKWEYAKGMLAAERDLSNYLARNPKAALDKETLRSVYVSALRQHGIDFSKDKTTTYQDFMSPGDRMKEKYLEGK